MNFFKHENQACPPSISDQENLRLPRQKSELASCLQALTTPKNAAPANCEVIIMDGAALVNMLKPTGKEKTFSEYASNKFIPYVTAQLQHVKRIDICLGRIRGEQLESNNSEQTWIWSTTTSRS